MSTFEQNQSQLDTSIRHATETDIPAMVSLSYQKRRAYEKAQPQFWRHAEGAEALQNQWFKALLATEDTLLLVAESQSKILGFLIGRLIQPPEVYNPGGLTLMIDDFCVESALDWSQIGKKLIDESKKLAKIKGATQILVVCGAHDEPKSSFLKNIDLSVASEWYVGNVV